MTTSVGIEQECRSIAAHDVDWRRGAEWALWSGAWWIDPAVGLAIAGAAVWQGVRAWRGEDCGY